jgi:hypothetical protein
MCLQRTGKIHCLEGNVGRDGKASLANGNKDINRKDIIFVLQSRCLGQCSISWVDSAD